MEGNPDIHALGKQLEMDFANTEKERETFLKDHFIPSDDREKVNKKEDGQWYVGDELYENWKIRKLNESRDEDKEDRNDLYRR